MTKKKLSEGTEIRPRVRQDCVLSPSLFNTYSEEIVSITVTVAYLALKRSLSRTHHALWLVGYTGFSPSSTIGGCSLHPLGKKNDPRSDWNLVIFFHSLLKRLVSPTRSTTAPQTFAEASARPALSPTFVCLPGIKY